MCKLTAKNFLIARNGTRYEIEGLASPIMNRCEKLVGTAIVFRDVTKARKMARKLSWQANHDPLTKLYNRRKFEEYAAQAISDSHLDRSRHSLCYLDLDRFKIVNDTCGHAAGDKLLRQVTKLLQTRIRNADIFARLGGDEFGIIFHQCPVEIALNCANELRKLVEDFRFVWQDKIFRIGVSIGLVEIKPTTGQLSSLLNSADAACYIAKRQGGNHVHLCHDRDSIVVRQQGERQWVEKINYALENNYLRLYAQKIAPIQENLPFYASSIEHYAIPPQTICFEITETVAITNFEQANVLITQLKELGCSIALDDFGSGMSSLNYLKNLPIDYLKIDGSFVTNIASDAIDYATVECFHHLSQIMKIETIAEFVENQTILEKLQQIGIDYAQGYGIERPKPLIWEEEKR